MPDSQHRHPDARRRAPRTQAAPHAAAARDEHDAATAQRDRERANETSSVYAIAITIERDEVVDDARASAGRRAAGRGCRGPTSASTPEGERRVRRHRDAPATRARMAEVEREEDQRSGRSSRRSRRPAVVRCGGARRSSPMSSSPPRLQPDNEEEEDHQPVVDPAAQALRDPGPADADREVLCPEGVVRASAGVRPDDRDEHGGQEDDRSARLGTQVVRRGPARLRAQAVRPVIGCAAAVATGK